MGAAECGAIRRTRRALSRTATCRPRGRSRAAGRRCGDAADRRTGAAALFLAGGGRGRVSLPACRHELVLHCCRASATAARSGAPSSLCRGRPGESSCGPAGGLLTAGVVPRGPRRSGAGRVGEAQLSASARPQAKPTIPRSALYVGCNYVRARNLRERRFLPSRVAQRLHEAPPVGTRRCRGKTARTRGDTDTETGVPRRRCTTSTATGCSRPKSSPGPSRQQVPSIHHHTTVIERVAERRSPEHRCQGRRQTRNSTHRLARPTGGGYIPGGQTPSPRSNSETCAAATEPTRGNGAVELRPPPRGSNPAAGAESGGGW